MHLTVTGRVVATRNLKGEGSSKFRVAGDSGAVDKSSFSKANHRLGKTHWVYTKLFGRGTNRPKPTRIFIGNTQAMLNAAKATIEAKV